MAKNKTTARASQKRPFSCISFCFTASPVSDEGLAGGSKRKPPPWFPWARSRKKMKPTAAPVETPVESLAAKNPRTRPGAPKSSSMAMGNYGPLSPLELEQTNLPLVATHENSGRLSFGSSSAKFQTGSSTSKPGTTSQRIAGGASAADAADSNVLVRRETLEPVVGLWLMVAMLAIMWLAGPATAVVCFCSCLYMCPRSSPTAVVAADCGGLREDLNSAEHKKRVILEGLLERKRRRPSITASTDSTR